jgi:hypothetical protein
VTKDGLVGPDSQAEIAHLAGQTGPMRRHLAVNREHVDVRLLSARLPGMQWIEWFSGDPEPDARFWEVYCALTRTPAGDRHDWAEHGRGLLGDWKPGEAWSDGSAPSRGPEYLDCPSRPVLARPTGDWTLVLTDSGICFQVDRVDPPELHRLPDLDGYSAVGVDAAGKLFVGFYEGMIATPRTGEWAYHAADSPVLSLVPTPRGLALGDPLGNITFRDIPASPSARIAVGEPVVEMIELDDEVLALGARGGLYRVSWSDGGSISLSSIAPNEALGRPVGLFATGNSSKVGVFSADRLALLGRGSRSLTVGISRYPDGVSTVVPFGAGPGSADRPLLGILTDAGQLWIASAELKGSAAVVLPEDSRELVGLASGPAGWLLAWSAGGTLVAVGHDRGVRTLAASHVALAYFDPLVADRIAAVCWQPDRGVKVRGLKLEPAR